MITRDDGTKITNYDIFVEYVFKLLSPLSLPLEVWAQLLLICLLCAAVFATAILFNFSNEIWAMICQKVS